MAVAIWIIAICCVWKIYANILCAAQVDPAINLSEIFFFMETSVKPIVSIDAITRFTARISRPFYLCLWATFLCLRNITKIEITGNWNTSYSLLTYRYCCTAARCKNLLPFGDNVGLELPHSRWKNVLQVEHNTWKLQLT